MAYRNEHLTATVEDSSPTLRIETRQVSYTSEVYTRDTIGKDLNRELITSDLRLSAALAVDGVLFGAMIGGIVRFAVPEAPIPLPDTNGLLLSVAAFAITQNWSRDVSKEHRTIKEKIYQAKHRLPELRGRDFGLRAALGNVQLPWRRA